MKELIKKEIDKENQVHFKRLVLAEFLQHLILQSIYRHNAFRNLTFTGGTALRILYHTGRYSEDLNFSLTKKNDIELTKLLVGIQNDIKKQGIELDLYLKKEKTVFNADFRFPHLLKEFNLSPLKDQELTIKVEVDQNPPSGGKKEIMLVASPISYTISVFDLPSLFAAKLSAIFFRRYTKGRDFYDLIWFLGKGIKPDFSLLNNAIKQTQGKNYMIKEKEFKQTLIKRLESVDFKKIKSEVERFIVDKEELDFLGLGPIKSLLRNYN